MGAPNPNWHRWIHASIAQFFTTGLGSFPVYIEGAERSTNKLTDYCELRIDGPHFWQYSQVDFEIKVLINVLVSSTRNETDLYTIERNNGNVASTFAVSIPIYRLGTGIGDDQSLIDCLILWTPPGRTVSTSNFGLIEVDTPVSQSVVEGQYRGYFSLP